MFAGGYIGLFLGNALLQTPNQCFKMIERTRKTFLRICGIRQIDGTGNVQNGPDDVGTGVRHVEGLET